jgi:Bacterial transglutaminase-like N-terminal region/Transglutaminase-like superfamily
MRIHISHATAYTYSQPVRSVTQMFRMTPRDHDGQEVLNWRLETSVDGRIRLGEDEFGNITYHFTTEGPIRELTVQVEGLIETTDTGGLIRGTHDQLPDGVFLRDSDLTRPNTAIQDFAIQAARGAKTDLEKLHQLMNRINADMIFDTGGTAVTTTAIEAFALGRGVCQDLTHVFLAASRHLNIPARYVSGYFHRADGVTAQEAGSRSIPPTAFAEHRPMSASRLGSTMPMSPPSAARDRAVAPRRWQSPCRSSARSNRPLALLSNSKSFSCLIMWQSIARPHLRCYQRNICWGE